MNEEYIKAIHAAYGEDKLGSYDDFYSEITSNKDYRDLVYNQLGGSDVFGDYNDFTDLVSIKQEQVQEDVKKKDTPQPYQPTSEEPTEVSKIPSESIDLGVYPTAFTPKEDIERVSEAGGISDEKLKRKASEIALESTSTLRKQQKELENQIKGYQEVFNNSKTRLEDIQLEFSELNDNLSNKYGLYYNQETGAYDIPKSMQPQFNQDVSVLNQLQKDFEAVQQGIKDNANAYRNSANRYAINKEALAQRGTPIGTFMTNLVSEGIPTIVGGLGAAAVDLTSYTRPDLLAMRMAGGGAEQYVRLGAEELRGKVDKVQDEMSNFLYDKIGVNVGSTKEYIEQQTEEGDFWNIAAGGLGTSIPAMLTAGLTGGASFYAQMYDFADEAVKDVEGLSEGEKVAYKTTVAAITGALEKYGFSSLLKNKSITNSVVGRVLKRLPSVAKGKSANVSDDFINIVLDEGRIANATMNRFGQKAIDVGTRMATGFLAEAETGGLQSLAENSIEQSINLLKGEEVFDSKDWYDFTKEFLFDAAAEGVGGAAISGTIGLFSRKGATKKQFDAAAKYLGDIRLEAIGAALEADVEAGNMTKEQAKATYDKIKQYKEDLARLPEDIPDSKKGEAVSLIQKRNGLQEKLGKVDESFKPKVQQEIDNINAKLAEMGSVEAVEQAPVEEVVTEETETTQDIEAEVLDDLSNVEAINKLDRNEELSVDEVEQAMESLIEISDKVDQNKNPELYEILDEYFTKLSNYGKGTEVEIEEVTKKVPVGSPERTRRFKQLPKEKRIGERIKNASVKTGLANQGEVNEVLEVDEETGNAKVVFFDETGKRTRAVDLGVKTDQLEYVRTVLDDNGEVVGVVVRPPVSEDVNVEEEGLYELEVMKRNEDDELPLDIAIEARLREIGQAPEVIERQEYIEVIERVEKKAKQETDAISIEKTSEVPVQPEEEVGGEMEEGVPDTEPQEATQEGEGEQELSALETAQTKVQLPSIKAAMPFLDGFDITKLTEDQINLLNEVMETYLETGELVGDGTLRAIVEGIQGAESNGPNAKMTADSLDIGAGEYLNLIAAIMGRAKNAWIRLQRELGLTGDNGLTIGLTKASAFRNNFYEIIERVTGNKVYEKGTESRVQVVGIVLQRIGEMVGNRYTVEQVINDVLDDFQETAEYLKVYGDPSLGDYASNIEKAVAKVRGATTADEVLSKLTPKEKEVLEVYYEANNVGIDEKIEVSKANGRPLKVIPNYLHIPIRSKTVVEPQNSTPTNNTLSNPAQINISNAFAPQTVSTKSTGAQKSRVANAHKLPEGSYYDPMFFSAQAKSFNNTNVAIFTYQAIQKMNAFLSTGEAVERFGGGKRGRSNIEAFQKSVNQALNAESLSAKASAELREFKVSGVKVGEALNTFQRIAKKKAIVWVMARPAQFFLQAPVFINTIGHVLMSPLMLKNPIAAMAVLQRAIVFQTQTWTKEKGWQNRRGLPWADLIKLAPAGIRDIRESFAFMEGDSEDVISRRSGITNKAIKVYDKADDYALKYSVAVTDRAAAQMSWLSLYETYMLEKGLVEGADLTNRESYNEWWKSQGQNPNYDAIAYADTMVAKDQNASANFQRAILQTDKSAFEKLFRSLVFPLINFKINKIQSIRSESKIISTINKKVTAEDRLSAGGRLLFTAAEMAVYHQASIFFVGAWKELVDLMWKSGIDYITGDDDDDEIFDEDDMGKTIKNQKRFWTRWITESSPLLSTLNIDQRMQNGMAEAYNFMCYQFNKQTDTAFASQYPEYESYARSGEAPAKVEFIDEGIGNAGYLGIVAEQVMTIDEMWEAAMNGERENQYGEMVYYTPEQQKSLKFTATLATINAIMPSHPLTAEVFGMVNRSFYKENNKAYDNMLARDLETIGKGIPEEDAIAIMNSYIQTTYKDLFEQEGITALTAIGESLKRDIGNVVKREVLKESFKSLYNSEDAKINEFLVRASRGGSPRDKANKIFARIKALDKMGETEKRDKLAYEAYVLSLKGITVGQDQGLSIVLLLDAYNYNKNVLGGKSFLELSTEMSKKYGGGGNNEK